MIRGSERDDPVRALVAGRTPVISFVTVGELTHWVTKAKWSAKRIEELERLVATMGVIPGNNVVARQYGRLKAHFGTSKQDNDLWIAACAMVGQRPIPIITLDGDFDEIGAFAGVEVRRPGSAE